MLDYRLPSGALVRALLNEKGDLPHEATEENLIFGQPSTLLTDERGDTTVAIRGVINTDYRAKDARVYYHKLDLSVLFQGNYTPRFTALGQSDLHRLLPALNQALGTGFTSEDLENVNVSLLGEGDELHLELRAKPTSLAYRGVTRVIFDRRRLYLVDVITVEDLSPHLTHPDGFVDGLKSAALATWGQDFTLIHHLLGVNERSNNYRGQYRQYSALRQALATEYGLDNWPEVNRTSTSQSRLRKYDTRQVARANTDFQYVVVHTHLRDNGYFGTAYFHFNQPD